MINVNLLGLKKNPFRVLEKQVGYSFRNRALIERALVHPSFRSEHPQVLEDNQRLEFLGDAVLSMVAAAHIYALCDDWDEGMLTEVRSRITSGKALARIARGIGIGAELRLGKGEERSGGRSRDSGLADALEAIVGAAYLDGGLRAAEKIFKTLFVPALEDCGHDQWEGNPKGQLQEVAQRIWQTGPKYRILKEEGPQHARIYTVEVVCGGGPVGRGVGNSKREAETCAAYDALRHLDTTHLR